MQFQTLQLGKKAACKLNCLRLTEAGLKAKLRDFEVDYDLSEVHKKHYGFYYLKNMETKTNPYVMVIEDKDTISYINDIKLLSNIPQCNCDTIQ